MSTQSERYANSAYRSSRDACRAEHYAMDMRDARAEIAAALIERHYGTVGGVR
jgi:hypothetical protein